MPNKRYFYISTCKIGTPDGPGVNEATFFEAARLTLGDRFIPLGICHGSQREIESKSSWRKSIDFTLMQLKAFISTLRWRIVSETDEPLIVRLGLLPVGFAIGVVGTKKKIHIKTIGDLSFLTRGNISGFRKLVWRCLSYYHLRVWHYVLRKAHTADVCTPELKQRLAESFGSNLVKKCTVIPNGIDPMRFQCRGRARLEREKRAGQSEVVLGYCGGAPIQRGGWHIIRAVQQLRQEGWCARGLVAGGDEKALRGVAEQQSVDEWVCIKGRVPAEEIPDLIGQIDIGVALDSGWRANLVGNSYQKVNQYLACGAEVIMTPTGDRNLASLGSVRVVNPEAMQLFVAAVKDLARRPWTERLLDAQDARRFVVETRGAVAIVNARLDWISSFG